jgi:hypothetical protein
MNHQITYPRRAIEATGTVHAARGGPRYFTTACATYPAPEVERVDASLAYTVTCPACIQALAPLRFERQPYTGICDTCRTYWNTVQNLGEEWNDTSLADRPPLSDQIARALAMYGQHAFTHLGLPDPEGL